MKLIVLKLLKKAKLKRKCPFCKKLILVENDVFVDHASDINNLISGPSCEGSNTMPKKRTFNFDNYPTYDTSTGFGNPKQWQEAFQERFTDIEINSILNGQDPYTVLGVTRSTPAADIKTAYRILCLKWHPDKNADPNAKEQFQKINAAYQKITKPV